MWKIEIRSSPTQVPVESFAETAFSLDMPAERHTPRVRLPPAYARDCVWKQEWLQGEDGAWNIAPLRNRATTSAYQANDLPRRINPTCDVHTDIKLGKKEPVEGWPVVRLPVVGETPAISLSDPVGAGEGVAQAPEGGVSPLPGVRLRKRGRITRTLESIATEEFFSRWTGGKTSSASLRTFLAIILRRGVKLNWLEQVTALTSGTGDDETMSYDVILNLSVGKVDSLVSMRLFTHLLSKAMFKRRTVELRASLVAKAQQFAAELGMNNSYLLTVLPGSVAYALLVSYHEANAVRAQGDIVGLISQEQSNAISSGKMPKERKISFWESVKRGWTGKPLEVVLPHAKT